MASWLLPQPQQCSRLLLDARRASTWTILLPGLHYLCFMYSSSFHLPHIIFFLPSFHPLIIVLAVLIRLINLFFLTLSDAQSATFCYHLFSASPSSPLFLPVPFALSYECCLCDISCSYLAFPRIRLIFYCAIYMLYSTRFLFHNLRSSAKCWVLSRIIACFVTQCGWLIQLYLERVSHSES